MANHRADCGEDTGDGDPARVVGIGEFRRNTVTRIHKTMFLA